MANTATPPAVKAPEPKNKAKASGSKSSKSNSSPTTSFDIKSIKKCPRTELQMLAKSLNERIIELCDDEEASPSSPQSIGQGSVYQQGLFQDNQDPFT